MLELVNAKKTDKDFSAYYIPESSKEKGFIKMDLKGNVLEKKLTSYDEDIAIYFAHARKAMRRCLEKGFSPYEKEWVVMWY